jgi:hypothetical protein
MGLILGLSYRGKRVFESRVLGRIFGPRWDEGEGDWRRLFNEELHNLYASSNNIRVNKEIKEDEMGGACSRNKRYEKCIHYFG